MQSGKLRHLVLLEDSVPTRGALGGEIPGWGNPRYAYASAEVISGREVLAGQGLTEESTVRFVMRYDETLAKTSRITWREDVYNIRHLRNVEGKDRMLEVLATTTGR